MTCQQWVFTLWWQSGGDEWRRGANMKRATSRCGHDVQYLTYWICCRAPSMLVLACELSICAHLSLPILWTAVLILQAMLPRPRVICLPCQVQLKEDTSCELESSRKMEPGMSPPSLPQASSGMPFLWHISCQIAPMVWSQLLDYKNIAPLPLCLKCRSWIGFLLMPTSR